MNVIVVIEGREAIPVRAIPLLTNFETISVDYVAHVLAWDEEYHGFDGLQAFHLDNPQRPISATWWENIACRELKALSDSIRAVEVTHETGLQDWRRKSLRVLPSGVFVWKDAFEPMHLCRYGRDGTTFLSTTALNGVIPEDEQERRVALDFDPFIPDLEIRHLVMEGFKPQATTPSPAPVPQAAPVVAASATTAALMPKQRAQEERILALLTSKGHNPMNLADRQPGKRGAKSEIRTLALLEPALFTEKTFDTAWQRLREDGRLAGGN